MMPPYQSQSRQNIIWKSHLEQPSKGVKSPWRREVRPVQEHWLPHCMDLVKAWGAVDLSRAAILTQMVREMTYPLDITQCPTPNSCVWHKWESLKINFQPHSGHTISHDPMKEMLRQLVGTIHLPGHPSGPARRSRKVPGAWVLELPVSSGGPHKQESRVESQRAP